MRHVRLFRAISNESANVENQKKTMKKTLIFILLLTGIACGEKEVFPNHTFDDFSYHFSNEGVIKSEIGNGVYYLLIEELSPLERSPGLRYLKKIAYDGTEIMRMQAVSSEALIDFSVSDQAIFILYSSKDNIQIKKYDLNGIVLSTKVIWENSSNSSYATDDRGSLVVNSNSLVVAIRPEDYSTWLYSLNTNDLEVNWSELIEPNQDIFGMGMTGGSYDTFEQLAHPYMVFLDLDEEGNAYVAVPALYNSSIYWHNQHFGENLSHLGESYVSGGLETDALVTKVNHAGERLYTVVAGSVNPDECYGIKVNSSSFYLYGRTGKPTSTVGYQWDAYLSKYNSDTGSPVFVRNFDIDKSEIIFDVAETNNGDIIMVGSTGWSQNPLGYSVSETARKLVAIVDNSGNFIEEFEVDSGLRHNQVRSIIYSNDRIWIGGWENGPGTHTGDNDNSLVFANAFWESFGFK